MKVLISIQLPVEHENTLANSYIYGPATFHEIEEKRVSEYCQFLADATQSQIRQTYPSTRSTKIKNLNGNYYRPKIKMPLPMLR